MAVLHQSLAGAPPLPPGPDIGSSLRRYYGWQIELDLRSFKQTLQMDVLRCRTPEVVWKELWAHVLAYNLIRTIMAQAAVEHGIEPRSISFKGAAPTLEAFQPVIAALGDRDPARCGQVYEQILTAVAAHRVGNRPDRFEPRLR
jgi:hypothetical protein